MRRKDGRLREERIDLGTVSMQSPLPFLPPSPPSALSHHSVRAEAESVLWTTARMPHTY